MDIVIIRHAESTNNRAWGLNPNVADLATDPGLTELGHAQADALAAWLAGFVPKPTQLFASPTRRTLLTAAPIAEALGMRGFVRPELMERGGPYVGQISDQRWHPGSPLSELAAISPWLVFPEQVTEQGWWQGPVEDQPQACARAKGLASWLRDSFSESDCVLLVTHSAIGSMLTMALFCESELGRYSDQLPGESSSWCTLDNSSVSWISTYGQDTGLRALNRLDHLVLAGLVR